MAERLAAVHASPANVTSRMTTRPAAATTPDALDRVMSTSFCDAAAAATPAARIARVRRAVVAELVTAAASTKNRILSAARTAAPAVAAAFTSAARFTVTAAAAMLAAFVA